MGLGLLRADSARVGQFAHVVGPGQTELTAAGQRTVTTDDDEAVNAVLDEVGHRGELALAGLELHGTGGTDHGTALAENAGDVAPAELSDVVTTVDGASPSLVDGEHLRTGVDAATHNRANRGVHPLGVAARGHHPDANRHRREPFGRTTLVACQSDATLAVFVSDSPATVTPSATELGPMNPGLPTFGVNSQM